MRITIKSPVEQSVKNVYLQFDRDLFLALSPPFPPVELKSFGMEKDDEVRLELNFILFKELWVSKITAVDTSSRQLHYFIDEGIQLPFFLGKWKHRHLIQASGDGGSIIIDDIEFEGRYPWMTPLLYPALYIQFLYRKPIYKRFFKLKKAIAV